MLNALEKNSNFKGRRGPVVLTILDGVGFGKYKDGDGFLNASTPVLDKLMETWPMTKLQAHGTAVGMPSDEDMGNSEVGHNAIGCGRVFAQGAKLVQEAIDSKLVFAGQTWKEAITNTLGKNSTMHFLGLLSDGNVHSNIAHLRAMLEQAKVEGIKKVRIHILLDGRDVPETSALDFVDPFEAFLAGLNASGVDFRIASGGGRMQITMDRYGADWSMVERGWKIHVLGQGDYFKSAHEAIVTLRENTGAIDQDLPPFVISDDGKTPVGPVVDGDTMVFFNFRGDRSLEITAAFEDEVMTKFNRGPKPDVYYCGMMEYDGDLHVPKNYLVTPPAIDKTLGEYLCASGVTQLAVSETQKFGHVTYFFNGNRSGMFDEKLEKYVEVPSDVVPFEQRPWMKCAEITDVVVNTIADGKYKFIRLNLANGDMVGHTGNMHAVQVAMGAVDICVGRIMEAVRKAGGVMIVTADHGNSDDMYEYDKKGNVKRNADCSICRKTSHSLNPVPCIVYDPECQGEYKKQLREETLGISSITATCIELLGLKAPAEYDKSVLIMKN